MDKLINQLIEPFKVKQAVENDEEMGEIEINEEELMEILEISSEEENKIEGLIEWFVKSIDCFL